MQHFLASRLPIFLCVLVGLPVPHRRLFPGSFMSVDPGRGVQILEGASDMPPTFVSWLPKPVSELWNAFLATFVWKEYSLLEPKRRDLSSYRVMYGDGRETVIPKRVTTRFVVVGHGKEPCRFALLNSNGDGEEYDVVARGDQRTILNAVTRELLEDGRTVYEVNEMGFGSVVTFV